MEAINNTLRSNTVVGKTNLHQTSKNEQINKQESDSVCISSKKPQDIREIIYNQNIENVPEWSKITKIPTNILGKLYIKSHGGVKYNLRVMHDAKNFRKSYLENQTYRQIGEERLLILNDGNVCRINDFEEKKDLVADQEIENLSKTMDKIFGKQTGWDSTFDELGLQKELWYDKTRVRLPRTKFEPHLNKPVIEDIYEPMDYRKELFYEYANAILEEDANRHEGIKTIKRELKPHQYDIDYYVVTEFNDGYKEGLFYN